MATIKLKAKISTKSQSQIDNSKNCMSLKTKDFIQKICYPGTASVDMTQYGFIVDSKIRPISLMLKPLTEKLKTICEKESDYRCRKVNWSKNNRYELSSRRSSIKTSKATEPFKKLKSRAPGNSRRVKNLSPTLTPRPRGVVTFAKTKVYNP